ncbi:class I SAM-dependent methyltransferase [Mycobacterium deserti]|uniref:class I SAM-dependent methyltransferase n=1 Tax=Mycobacterium deserti TaxID=2978347 RepID=UPI0028D7DAB2|nr:class I SAM-dependent methyltransferase [Mycobacterium deserti]
MDSVLSQTRTVIGRFPFPHWASVLLNNPIRRALERPDSTIDKIGLDGHEHVLELGPGPGFFSVPLAGRLPRGHLDLFDIQPGMLDRARRNLERAGHRNVGYHVGEADVELPFPDGAFDVAFLAEVIGEVSDKTACLRSLARVIKPGGVLVFREAFPDPDRLSVAELRKLAEPNDFAFADAIEGRWGDVVRFRRNHYGIQTKDI